jgi:hypothetical protein
MSSAEIKVPLSKKARKPCPKTIAAREILKPKGDILVTMRAGWESQRY